MGDDVLHRVARHLLAPACDEALNIELRVEFELRVVNSYDGSVAFSAISAARRLACLNGMTIGSSFRLYGRHTKGFGVTDLVGKLKAAITLYRQGTE